jgi:catechol 2,3-dioxygenase-like lactoylglutathione lyase family enzyme
MKMMTALFLSALVGVGPAFAAEKNFSKKKIDIGMIVSDLDKSMEFYKGVVGLVQVDQTEFDVDADFGKRSGLTDALPVHVEVLKLGPGEDATQLKLMTFGNKAKKQDNSFIHSHTGIQYLTLYVAEMEPILKRIRKQKVKLLGETPVALGQTAMFVLIQDPDGTFVELIGPMTKGK